MSGSALAKAQEGLPAHGKINNILKDQLTSSRAVVFRPVWENKKLQYSEMYILSIL